MGTIHLGAFKPAKLLRPRYYLLQLDSLVKDIVQMCRCTQVNPKGGEKAWEGACTQWAPQVSFTEIKATILGNKYLLIFIATFSRWVEAYPTQVLTASTVTKKLLQELIPRFRLPLSQSDSGPPFTGKVSPKYNKGPKR